MTETYIRGTKTRRVKTARIVPGDVLLTDAADREDRTGVALRKTGSVIRTVASLTPVMHDGSGFYRRAQRTYTVVFTDGTRSPNNAPSQTWDAIDTTEEA